MNRIVNVVALGIFRKAFDAGFLDLHIGHTPVLPNQALHALFSLRSILVVLPQQKLRIFQESPGRQLCG